MQFGEHGLFVLGVFHINKIQDDDAAQITQPQLPHDCMRGFEIGLENGVVEIAAVDIAAGVDINRGHRLGLLNDQVTTGFEVDPPSERALDFVFDTM